MNVREGQALALREEEKKPFSHRRAGACPPPCLNRRTFARDRPSRYGLKMVFFVDECSRGTGPRATGSGRRTLSHTVGRGPVPRHAWGVERSRGPGPRAMGRRDLPVSMAFRCSRGTGPRDTGRRRGSFRLNVREGQALALWVGETSWSRFLPAASRGTGPRATGRGRFYGPRTVFFRGG